MDENLVHIAESEPHYHLQKKIRSSENIINESEIEMQVPEDTDDIDPEDTDDIDPENTDNINSENADDIDSEDLQGASLDDTLDTIEGKNVPKCIAEWPNVAYRNFLELIVEDFKEKIVKSYNEVDFTLYYCPIFRAIQALLQRPEATGG
ncbi:hypothetical protein C1646_776579 [Rhizophagus diaphanus]|nr:hypothetical protein C1646_776579 [Rhizophagus diaphanus] [Rhizophagus sp. MUCL 43196]